MLRVEAALAAAAVSFVAIREPDSPWNGALMAIGLRRLRRTPFDRAEPKADHALVRTVLVVVMVAQSAWAYVSPLPLAYLANGADVVVVAVVEPARDGGEIGVLHVERVVKGSPKERVGILGAEDAEFMCDVTELKPGERALFLLKREGERYRILDAGRGKLPLGKDSVVQFPFAHDYIVTPELHATCSIGRLEMTCPLKAVLKELQLGLGAPMAFVTNGQVLGAAVPIDHLRCDVPTARSLSRCNVVETPRASPTRTGLCHGDADAGVLECWFGGERPL